MRVHHIVPWKTGDIGGGINEAIHAVDPRGSDWVCVRDGDTMFLTSDWGEQIEEIAADNGGRFQLIGCMTNRLRADYQCHGAALSNEPDIGQHVAIARERQRDHGSFVQPLDDGPIAGMFMLFPAWVWWRAPFAEKSIYFDQQFTGRVRSEGGAVGVALGLYIFHLYRWGQPDPANYKAHLE